MKKYSLIFSTFIFFSIISSCTNDNISNDDLEMKKTERNATFNNKVYSQTDLNDELNKISKKELDVIFKNFGIDEVNTINNNSEVYDILKIDRNQDLTEYVTFNTNLRFYLIDNDDDFQLIKANYKQGQIEISQKFVFKIDKYFKVKLIDSYEYQSETGTYKSSLCQREGNETQSQCEDREYDEFVEGDWVAWVAWHTHPIIPLMVSAMCMC